jgi:hypothetical protein
MRFFSLSSPKNWTRGATAIGISSATLLLGGCYVVPIQPESVRTTAPTAATPLPTPVTFAARLYPANELAAPFGMISAVVTNDLYGRGSFSTNIGGESFSGEATRSNNNSREGLANGAGNRGGYISCRYSMNSPTLGSGTCKLSNGALFTMHVGN